MRSSKGQLRSHQRHGAEVFICVWRAYWQDRLQNGSSEMHVDGDTGRVCARVDTMGGSGGTEASFVSRGDFGRVEAPAVVQA